MGQLCKEAYRNLGTMPEWLEVYIIIGLAVQATSLAALRKMDGPMWAAIFAIAVLTFVWPVLLFTFVKALAANLSDEEL